MTQRELHRQSPTLARAFLEYFLPTDIREPVLGDFEESFYNMVSRRGSARAVTWYWNEALRSIAACLTGKLREQYWMGYARFERAARTLVRHRRYSLTTTIGLALAFTCCILIALFEAHELSYDRYHQNSDRIFRVATPDGAGLPGPLGPRLRRGTPHVEQTARVAWGVGGFTRISRGAKQHYTEDRIFADGEAFELFDWNVVKKVDYALLDRPFSVVISRSLAGAIFGGSDPVGETVTIDKHDFVVTGVIEDIRPNSYIRPDFILSYSSMDSLLIYSSYERDWISSWGQGYSVTPTYVMVDDPQNSTEVAGSISRLIDENKLTSGYENEVGGQIRLQPLKELYLGKTEAWGVGKNGDPKRLVGMGIAVLLILLVAGINIINLVVAIWQIDRHSMSFRRVKRRRLRLFVRFTCESFLITLIALTFALFAARLLLPLFASLVDRELLIQTALIPWIIASSVPFALIVGSIAALNPDAFLSKKAGRTQGGMLVPREYHRTRFGRLLVAFQFVVAGALVFSATVMMAQTRFLKTMPLGYDAENLLVIPYSRGAFTPEQFQEMKTALLELPEVESAAASYQVPNQCPGSTHLRELGSKEPAKLGAHLFVGDSDFLSTYKIERLTPLEKEKVSPDGWTFWFNRTAVEALGWDDPSEALGRDVESIGACNDNWHMVVGGVFEDYQHCSIYHGVSPLIMCIPPEDSYWQITLRVNAESDNKAIALISGEWDRLRPDAATEPPYFLTTRIAQSSEEEFRVARQLLLLALIILAIACAGLIGLVSYTIQQRELEIVSWLDRGRGRVEVIARVGGSFMLMIAAAVVIAWPISFYATGRWLEKFAAQVNPGAGMFLLVGGVMVLLGLLLVILPTAWFTLSPKPPSRKISEVAYSR